MDKSKIEFPKKKGYSADALKKVQERLLDMTRTATEILERHGIHYFIGFGSLLGAVRHKGFIPWDDDFDLFLFDEEYETALDVLRKELPEDIVVHDQVSDGSYYAAWSKLRDKNSKTKCTIYPADNEHLYTGINVDLYRIQTVCRSRLQSYIKREHIQFLVRKHTVGLIEEEEYIRKFNLWTKEYVRVLEEEEKQPLAEEDKVYGFVVFIDYFELDEIWPLKRYEFEGNLFWGPNNYDAILKRTYGNYMELPQYEKRLPHYDEVEFCDERGEG